MLLTHNNIIKATVPSIRYFNWGKINIFYLINWQLMPLYSCSSHSMHCNVLQSLFVAMQLISNCTVMKAYSIATISNCMLN